MNFKNFQLSTLDHHAYCLEGDFETSKGELLKSLHILNFKTQGNPDFLSISYDIFGIDDAHEISRFQKNKAIAGEKKVIVIETKSLTREAQNSLLKTLEEPSSNTHFFLIIPSSEILLDTLKSRLVILNLSERRVPHLSERREIGEKFLKASKKERLEIARKIAEEKDKQKAINLLNQIEETLYQPFSSSRTTQEESIKDRVEILRTINKFRGYLNDRSPSIKMLLEHIAITAPQL